MTNSRRRSEGVEQRRKRTAITRVALSLVMFGSLLVGAMPARSATSAQQRAAIDGFPKQRPQDLPDRYRDWIVEEVSWIITDPEREVFLRLDSDQKRNRFIEAFWEQRDPTPGTPRNEYIPIHYERLDYANRQFGRAAPGPGWRSDMGRIYILLGEPQTRNRFDNDSTVYPVEVWFYQMDPRLGVPTFFYVVFFREQGMGEYKLYSPVSDGPERLLNPSGRDRVRRQGGVGTQGFGYGGLIQGGPKTYDALRFIHPDLAAAAFSLIPGEALLGSPLRSDQVIADILGIPERMVPTIEWAYPILNGVAETEVRFDTLGIEASAIGWLDPEGRPFVSYALRAPGPGVNLGEHEGAHYMTFSVASYLLDASRVVLEGRPPRLIQSALQENQVARIRSGALLYVDRIPAVSGELEFEMMIENNVSHEYGEVGKHVFVPSPNPDTVVLGQPILCVGARPLGAAYDRFAAQLPFQIGQLAMTPTIDGPFAVGSQLYVFHQILLPGTLTEPVSVTYSLADSSDAVVRQKQVLVRPDQADRFGVVNQLTAMALDVPAGSYSLRVNLDAFAGSAVLPVEVEAEVTRPIVHAAASPPATDPIAVIRRASVLRSAGDLEAAVLLAEDATARAPDSYEAQHLYFALLSDLGRQTELGELLKRRLVDTPHDIELLLQLAEAMARQGKHYDSIRFYERAVLERSESVDLLNALAAEYLADEGGDVDRRERAIELLSRSLTLDPEQLGVRTTLERARKTQR